MPSNPIPVFQFGSKETFKFSFASLADQTSGFSKLEGTKPSFLGSETPLFGQPSSDHEKDDYDPEKEVEGTELKPIVSLPAVADSSTGEEGETVVYRHRAKLYRYDGEVKQWKERGVGEMKILRNDENDRCRVVMRREQIHKLCANHLITADMELKENAGSDRSWVWSVNADFADGVAKSELLAVRFKHRDDAVMFRSKFVECQEKLVELGEKKEKELEKNVGVSNGKMDKESGDGEKIGKESKDEEEIGEEIKDGEEVGDEKEKQEKVEEESNDEGEGDEVVITSEKLPSLGLRQHDKSYGLSKTFYSGEEIRDDGVKSTSAVKDNGQSTKCTPPDISQVVSQPFVFGSSDISSLSFAALANKSDSKGGFTKSPQHKGFFATGTPLFAVAKPQETQDDDECDPERESSGVHFEPIVHLPKKVEESTGEENEEVMYCERVKLYRYDRDCGEWKERGVGNLKLLKERSGKRVRVLMRREQVFKICANHFISGDMELKANAGSDRSWVWHTNGDISDGEAKAEQLAARFKNAEKANEFKEKFEECQEELLKSSHGIENEEDEKEAGEEREIIAKEDSEEDVVSEDR